MKTLKYINENGDFMVTNADMVSNLYFPLVNEAGMMSSITPNLSGDCKSSQNTFLLAPASNETLHESNAMRNFWCRIHKNSMTDAVWSEGTPWSATGNSAYQKSIKLTTKRESVTMFGGLLWHKIIRENKELGISSEILSFVPANEDKVEIMQVVIKNISNKDITFTPTAAIPLYCRSADNIRDHRHVTSLLNKASLTRYGMKITPTLTFDERGHRKGEDTYYVSGSAGEGEAPIGFIPITADFIGEGGSYDYPDSIINNNTKLLHVGDIVSGYEMTAAIRFADCTLAPNESKSFQIAMGINSKLMHYMTEKSIEEYFLMTCDFWQKKRQTSISTANKSFDSWFKWVTIQPVLRRIYGCSFLPHHDYGKGGRGWRDLWQDSLALILIEPQNVRGKLLSHFGGVRTDGSNATIIGNNDGEFLADRNNITRVWMDHGFWPLLTVNLYIEQSGDIDFLLEKQYYFKDKQVHRGDKIINGLGSDTNLKQEYMGTVLEHILIQNITAFFDVGMHGHFRLRGADWNDGLDMASENGESVAFTAAYAGNFDTLYKLISELENKKITEVYLTEEILQLLDYPNEQYGDVLKMREMLDNYCESVITLSGNSVKVQTSKLKATFEQMSNYIKKHIRETEWISDGADLKWFNSYYDNSMNKVEGVSGINQDIRMMLTGQVFTILSGTAESKHIEQIVRAADWYLYHPTRGGYALNTDFKEVKLDMGRMFGFAYGHKENGAVFSHMAVMYAYALYSRGFIVEGKKVLDTLFRQADNFEISKIYPAIPEYFDIRGRGMYSYLTGAASWYILTVQTQIFGIKGDYDGNMLIYPKISADMFDEKATASIVCSFAGKQISVEYFNPKHKEYDSYILSDAEMNDKTYEAVNGYIKIPRDDFKNLCSQEIQTIKVYLE